MAVYKRGPLGIELPSMDGMLIPIVAVLILIGLFLVWPSASQNVLSAHVLQNPLYLSTNDSTILRVIVNNPATETVQNVVVTATAGGSNLLSVYPSTRTIPSLGPQESRVLEFLVIPLDAAGNPFLPGTYRLDVSTKIKNVTYQTSETVNVER